MANPRSTVAYDGIDPSYATFNTDNSTILYDGTKLGGSASVNLAVTLSGNSTIALAADGDPVVGKLDLVEQDNRARVQVGGFLTLAAGASATVTRGNKVVGALGPASAKGFIRDVASATAAELNKGRGQIIDIADTTNVVIWMF